MKLSAAIEQALVTGTYGSSEHGYYMCLALASWPEHVAEVQKLVNTLHIDTYDGIPLACALYKAGYLDENLKGSEQYTTQFYIWWVYDLKRKGL